MSFKSKIKMLRRKIGSWIVGDQLALFVPSEVAKMHRHGEFAKMDDASLAAFTRHFFALNDEIAIEQAEARDCTLDSYIRMSAVVTLAELARVKDHEVLTIRQSCYMGAESIGNWCVEITRLPDDYDFGPDGIVMHRDENGNIVTVESRKALDPR